jgi:hypothetical protein
MRVVSRGFLPLVLVLGALLGGSACSVGGSKISRGDVDKLNAANAIIRDMSDEYQQGLARCASVADKEGCLMKLLVKLAGEEQSVADTYEQVAAGAHGDCQTALHAAGGKLPRCRGGFEEGSAADRRLRKHEGEGRRGEARLLAQEREPLKLLRSRPRPRSAPRPARPRVEPVRS